MAPSDLSSYTPDEDQFGSNVARTKRIIAKLLLDWTKAQDEGSNGQRTNESLYLTAIYFDKLAGLFCRIWDDLKLQDKVRYPVAFQDQRGFHGPGRAMRINRGEEELLGSDPDDYRHHRWAFTTEIVEKLKPSLGNARVLFRLSGPPWKHNCRVYPQIDLSQWESWLVQFPGEAGSVVFLNSIEAEYVSEISRMFCSLNKHELRALGTHSSADETCNDIKFNLRSWQARFHHIYQSLTKKTSSVQLESDQLVNTTREVKRKSSKNRQAYETGWDKCVSQCRSEDVRSAFLAVQKPSNEIWGDTNVQRFQVVADPILNFSLYIRRGLSELGVVTNLKSREKEESNKSYLILKNPLPNVALRLRDYETLKRGGIEGWLSELVSSRDTLFGFIPPLTDLAEFGVP